VFAVVLAAGLGTIACGSPTSPSGGGGGGNNNNGGGGGGTVTDSATITITSAGVVSPSTVTIRQGGRVTFINNHSRPHDMSSDPHPEHSDCREIEQVGFLSPGQSRTSGNFNTVRSCGFHDHNEPDTAGLKGRITIVAQ
jgi:plastocyanin